MRRKAVIAANLPIRRGLDENEAAVYLALSPSFFRKLVAERRMPRPRLAGGRRVWDVAELDMAFKMLPREGGDDEPMLDADDQESKSNPWDGLLR
jgi:excisionase family DNA binding protein